MARLLLSPNPMPARLLVPSSHGYSPEEWARVESELARLDVRHLAGQLALARAELARPRPLAEDEREAA